MLKHMLSVVFVLAAARLRIAHASPVDSISDSDRSFLVADWCKAVTSKLPSSLSWSEASAALQDLAPAGNPRFEQERFMDEPLREAISGMGFHSGQEGGARMPHMLSQYGQDLWLYANHVRFMDRPGVYVDLAANDPMVISNTFFLDACKGWAGVCIEPNTAHHNRLRAARSCRLDTRCASDTMTKTTLITRGDKSDRISGHAHLGGMSPKEAALHAHRVHIECAPLKTILGAGITHIDVLSLDIEGFELSAMRSFNFSAVTIDIIIAENPAVASLLHGQHNYRVVSMFTRKVGAGEYAYIRNGFQLGIEKAYGKWEARGAGDKPPSGWPLLRVGPRKRPAPTPTPTAAPKV